MRRRVQGADHAELAAPLTLLARSRIAERRYDEAIEAGEVEQVCREVECPLIAVLVDMEYEGIRLDSEALLRYSKQLQDEIDQLQATIYKAAGREFNVNSPKQLGEILTRWAPRAGY